MSAKPSPARRAIREILFVAALFMAYKLGRLLVEGHVTEAFTNARTVWDLERLIHLPSEAALQASAVGHTWLIRAANCYYAYVHFPATAAALIWIYLRRPELYRWFRRTLATLTALALVTHALFPLAPPRMLTLAGLMDTGKIYGPSVYGSPSTDTLSNQYAAMPSLHVGWALAVAIALIAATRSRRRWWWLIHPILTLLVVVVTGNHYWLDAIAVVALLSLVLAVVTPLSRTATPAPVLAPTAPADAIPAPAGLTSAGRALAGRALAGRPSTGPASAGRALAGPALAGRPSAGRAPADAAGAGAIPAGFASAGAGAVPTDAAGGAAGDPPSPPPAADPKPHAVPIPIAPAPLHPLLASCVQLATLVPGASLTAFLPDLLNTEPAPASVPHQRPPLPATPPALEPRLLKATFPAPPGPRSTPATTLNPKTAPPPPTPPKASAAPADPAQPHVPRQRSAAAPSRPPFSPAVTRPGPTAPRSRTAPNR